MANLAHSFVPEIRKEAMWVLCNTLTETGDNGIQARYLIIKNHKDASIFLALEKSLKETHLCPLDLTIEIMTALNLFLNQDVDNNSYIYLLADQIEKTSIVDLVHDLGSNTINQQVFELCKDFLDAWRHFEEILDEDAELEIVFEGGNNFQLES